MLITSFTSLEKWYIWRYIGYKDVTKTKRGEVSGWDNRLWRQNFFGGYLAPRVNF